ncbi:MAG TPA: hypothetical protein VF426_12195 [Marmoricola sp.]
MRRRPVPLITAALAAAALAVPAGALAPAEATSSAPANATKVTRTVTLVAPSSVAVGHKARLNGKVTKSPTGTTVIIQRLRGTTWITATTVKTHSTGGYYTTYVPITATGKFEFRAVAPVRSIERNHKVVKVLRRAVSVTRVVKGRYVYTTRRLIKVPSATGSANPGFATGNVYYEAYLPKGKNAWITWNLNKPCRSGTLYLEDYGNYNDNASARARVLGDNDKVLASTTLADYSTREVTVNLSGQHHLKVSMTDTTKNPGANDPNDVRIDQQSTLSCAW